MTAARLAVALSAMLLLAGCGGGTEVSWCFGSGSVSAGHNSTQCPPNPDRKAGESPP